MKLQQLNEMEILQLERSNTGSTRTNNAEFDKNGYIVVKGMYDPLQLYHPIPRERGVLNYTGDINQFQHNPEGADFIHELIRTNHPQYKKIDEEICKKVEDIIERKLYNTFYWDKFSLPEQDQRKSLNTSVGEISVLIPISTNLKKEWPIHIKGKDTYTNKDKTAVLVPGKVESIVLECGDALIYLGCERPVWRDKMPDNPKTFQIGKFWIDLRRNKEQAYYHQICFNYVLADGNRAQCAYGMTQ